MVEINEDIVQFRGRNAELVVSSGESRQVLVAIAIISSLACACI